LSNKKKLFKGKKFWVGLDIRWILEHIGCLSQNVAGHTDAQGNRQKNWFVKSRIGTLTQPEYFSYISLRNAKKKNCAIKSNLQKMQMICRNASPALTMIREIDKIC
jgi:membrane-anchored protein YejM (alkaline phosphatase superfamily)